MHSFNYINHNKDLMEINAIVEAEEFDATEWPFVIKAFATFLSTVYGYDITDQIYIDTGDLDLVSLKDIAE
jgi:hypothetical protein